MKNPDKTEQIEIDMLLETIYRQRGYDFRNYARASLERRVRTQMDSFGLKYISELIPYMLYDDATFDSFLRNMSITVTDMFRDPHFFKALRTQVIPNFAALPYIKIWCAGCATGEEVYSLAIILKEVGLYDRCQIYATDYNTNSLDIAKNGQYPLDKMKQFITNYNKAGGNKIFGDYYHARYNFVKLHKGIREKIVFSHHNLVSDSVFGEMNLILCRNVLIYFNQILQNRVFTLFNESLANGGFLCLGTRESLEFSSLEPLYKKELVKQKIFRKK
ncbi:MAG: protein-glutamate O-methyltransferase CheR [Desulfobacterales bacterium]|nr:protein-glutamate O-methyltransferase CheR [Desulfobacterales bacterium]MCP4162874.1 protein-glutamate O-methyltransferase CheR [Deltaproteobacteria bacterium]